MALLAVWLREKWRVLAIALLACFAIAIGGGAMWRHLTAPLSTGAPASPAPVDPSRVDYVRLDARIGRLMLEPDMVGLAIGAVEKGRPRFVRGYGVTLAGSADPVTPDTVFRWASLSKGVAAALVVKLEQEGRLSLDARVASLGATLTLRDDAAGATVADVLSHRLGLSRNAWDDRLEAGEDPKVLRARLGALPSTCPPGTCFSYQNIAFDAASEIVEHLSGQTYADAARQSLFTPLGMTSATMDRTGLQSAASWARPHRLGKRPTVVNDNYYRVPAAGGVNGSIRDLTLWMLAQMGQAPDVLSPAALATMQQSRVSPTPRERRGPLDPTDDGYGLGWRSFTYGGHRLVGHRGSVDGYASLILFDPADKSGIVMLWNANYYRPARLQLEFFDMLYGLPLTDRLDLEERTIGATSG